LNYLYFIILISLFSVILFFGNSLGVNVLLFVVPYTIFTVYMLIKKKKLKNKKALLFMIPIFILSANYLIYDNIFQVLNFFILPVLYGMMLMYSVKTSFNLATILEEVCELYIMPLCPKFIRNFYNILLNDLNKKINLSKNNKKRLLSLFIIIPIVVIVLALLISADLQFKNLFSGLFSIFDGSSVILLLCRLFMFIITCTYIGAFFNYLLFNYKDNKKVISSNKKDDLFTIKTLLIILNIIYIVFDIIQIRSLLFHKLDSGIVYSEYARSGFFQLMFISFINLGLLLITKQYKDNNIVKHMSLVMVFLTMIILCSSFYRMYMYDMAYGYTVLRLFVYIILITEFLMFIPTIAYIYNSKINILKHYIIITISIYTFINLFSIDFIIAHNNIDRYKRMKKIDIDYLMNYNSDNINELYKLYNKIENDEYRKKLYDYLLEYKDYINSDNDSIFEFNLSKNKAKEVLKNIDKK